MRKILKKIRRYWQRRQDRLYFKSRWNLIFDISLAAIIVILVGALITINLYHPELGDILKPSVEEKYNLDLNNPPLKIDFSSPELLDKLSDEFILKINFRNESRIPVKGLKIELVPANRDFYIDDISWAEGEYELNDNWQVSGTQISFSDLDARARQEVPLTINWKSRSSREKIITWQAQIEYFVQGQLVKESFNLPSIRLSSELSGQALAYYHSPQGDQLGSGPVPPLVSIPTNYWIFFRASGDGDFRDLVFSGQLSPGVELTGNRSLVAGSFTYNAARRQVVWTVPEVKAGDDYYRIGFEIQFIPQEDHLGKTPSLVNNIQYYATDSLSGKEKQGRLKNISTDLLDDKLNSGQGVVDLP
jgi:hypothetical protein